MLFILLFITYLHNTKAICNKGPYYYENVVHGSVYIETEGIGHKSEKMVRGLLLSEIFNLTYILNNQYLKSSHESTSLFIDLLDYNYVSDCNYTSMINNTHLTFIYINNTSLYDKNEENLYNLFFKQICNSRELKTPIEINSESSIISTFLNKTLMYKNQHNIVYVFTRSYSDAEYLSCLDKYSFYNSFSNMKRIDISNNIRRYTKEKNTIIISYIFRFGDSFYSNPIYNENMNNIAMKNIAIYKGIQIIKNLLYSNLSILYYLNNLSYKLYFFSEKENNIVKDSNIKSLMYNISKYIRNEFTNMYIRIDETHSYEDMDIISTSDILLHGYSKFHTFLSSICEKNTVNINKGNSDYYYNNDSFTFNMFNKLINPFVRLFNIT